MVLIFCIVQLTFSQKKRSDIVVPGNTKGGYHCTVDLLFDWFGISCMTNDNFFVFI
jgi:hypothetical protein